MTDIFALPRTIKNNPYLNLLYDAVENRDYTVKSFSFGGIFSALFNNRRVIIHIHWESNLYGSRLMLVSLWRMVYRFALLFVARALGAKIVWTMHNLASHDYAHPRLDALGRALMWRAAQAVIIQNKKVAHEMQLAHPDKKVRSIPHGNYVGVYGPLLAPQPHEGRVLLSLGAIRPYKHLEALITASAIAGVRLVIAGKGDPTYIASLRAQAGPFVSIEDRFVPEAQIPRYFAAADYGIFAYGDSSLTSGAIILALSYGLPVIAVATPATEPIQNGVNGYVVKDTEELISLLKKLPVPPTQERVKATVAGDTWERVGDATRRLYSEV